MYKYLNYLAKYLYLYSETRDKLVNHCEILHKITRNINLLVSSVQSSNISISLSSLNLAFSANLSKENLENALTAFCEGCRAKYGENPDINLALIEFEKSQKFGLSYASIEIAKIHELGQGVQKDSHKATEYFIKAISFNSKAKDNEIDEESEESKQHESYIQNGIFFYIL